MVSILEVLKEHCSFAAVEDSPILDEIEDVFNETDVEPPVWQQASASLDEEDSSPIRHRHFNPYQTAAALPSAPVISPQDGEPPIDDDMEPAAADVDYTSVPIHTRYSIDLIAPPGVQWGIDLVTQTVSVWQGRIRGSTVDMRMPLNDHQEWLSLAFVYLRMCFWLLASAAYTLSEAMGEIALRHALLEWQEVWEFLGTARQTMMRNSSNDGNASAATPSNAYIWLMASDQTELERLSAIPPSFHYVLEILGRVYHLSIADFAMFEAPELLSSWETPTPQQLRIHFPSTLSGTAEPPPDGIESVVAMTYTLTTRRMIRRQFSYLCTRIWQCREDIATARMECARWMRVITAPRNAPRRPACPVTVDRDDGKVYLTRYVNYGTALDDRAGAGPDRTDPDQTFTGIQLPQEHIVPLAGFLMKTVNDAFLRLADIFGTLMRLYRLVTSLRRQGWTEDHEGLVTDRCRHQLRDGNHVCWWCGEPMICEQSKEIGSMLVCRPCLDRYSALVQSAKVSSPFHFR
jgi:hypothetical protein